VQHEPRNMGGWPFLHERLTTLLGSNQKLRYVGLPISAAPATDLASRPRGAADPARRARDQGMNTGVGGGAYTGVGGGMYTGVGGGMYTGVGAGLYTGVGGGLYTGVGGGLYTGVGGGLYTGVGGGLYSGAGGGMYTGACAEPYRRVTTVAGVHRRAEEEGPSSSSSSSFWLTNLQAFSGEGAPPNKRFQRTACHHLLLLISCSARGTQPLNRRPVSRHVGV